MRIEASARTSSLAKIGHWIRTARAMASLGREEIAYDVPFRCMLMTA